MKSMPLIFENPVIKKHAAEIIDYINSHQEEFGSLGPGYWQGRTIYTSQIKDYRLIDILKEHKKFLLSEFVSLTACERDIYIDSLHLVRWTEGYELMPHADAENPDGSKHEFFWRDFGTVTFLNEDFEGGDLYLPNQNITIKAKVGYSAIFPGNLEYLHGVSKVTKGTRYTIASFLTYDKSREYAF
jgi:predicted 2-oxoglutarate/Fe(II)-dependent dioxygenase YbiX